MRIAASKKGVTTGEVFRAGFLEDTAKLFPDRSPIVKINNKEVSNKVLLKVNGGPGRVDLETLKLANQLFVHLYLRAGPGYPNGSGYYNQEMVGAHPKKQGSNGVRVKAVRWRECGSRGLLFIDRALAKKVHTNRAD